MAKLIISLRIFTMTLLVLSVPAFATFEKAVQDLPFSDKEEMFESNWWDDTTSNSKVDIGALPKLTLRCEKDSKHLFPTNPQQHPKEYHVKKFRKYRTAKVPFEATNRKSVYDSNGKLVSRADPYHDGSTGPCVRGNGTKCVAATKAIYYLMSNTYMDACGNLYRGFWEVSFLEKWENMGTDNALGRSYTVEGEMLCKTCPKEVTDTDSNPVDINEFVYLTPLFPGDEKKIKEAQEGARLQGFTFDKRTHLFKKNVKANASMENTDDEGDVGNAE